MFARVAPYSLSPEDAADQEIDRLALAYRAGRRQVLGELHRALEPVIGWAVRQAAAQGLPSALEVCDLEQQTWLVLADLARRWRPELGAFAGYVVSSLPWALGRYIRTHSPARRGTAVRVVAMEEDELQRLLEEQPGDDGSGWDAHLTCEELLAPLPEQEREVVALRVLEHHTFPAIGASLKLSASQARRAFGRGLFKLRGGQVLQEDDARRELQRLVRALYRGASDDGQVPGRAWVCAETGLTRVRYAQLMECLVAAGCIRDRTQRYPGWLVEPDPAEALRRVLGED